MNVGDPDGSSRKKYQATSIKSEELEKALSQGVRWFIVVKKWGNAHGAKEPGWNRSLIGNVKS